MWPAHAAPQTAPARLPLVDVVSLITVCLRHVPQPYVDVHPSIPNRRPTQFEFGVLETRASTPVQRCVQAVPSRFRETDAVRAKLQTSHVYVSLTLDSSLPEQAATRQSSPTPLPPVAVNSRRISLAPHLPHT